MPSGTPLALLVFEWSGTTKNKRLGHGKNSDPENGQPASCFNPG
jgi:hypothetical protein